MREKKRTGIYVAPVVLDLLDLLALHRKKSRNAVLEELIVYLLAPELLETKSAVVEKAIADVKADLEVRDGQW